MSVFYNTQVEFSRGMCTCGGISFPCVNAGASCRFVVEPHICIVLLHYAYVRRKKNTLFLRDAKIECSVDAFPRFKLYTSWSDGRAFHLSWALRLEGAWEHWQRSFAALRMTARVNDDFIKQVGSAIHPGESVLFLLTSNEVAGRVLP
jgi:hypothetical protein